MVHTLGPINKHRVKVLVDCSSFGNLGNVGLLRNDRGNWLDGFSRYCGRVSNLLAELSAIWRGLQLAWILVTSLLSWNQIFSHPYILLLMLSKMTFISMQHCCLSFRSYLLFLGRFPLIIYLQRRQRMSQLIDQIWCNYCRLYENMDYTIGYHHACRYFQSLKATNLLVFFPFSYFLFDKKM
jgi:hypothetical protein